MGNHEQILRKWQLLSPYLNRRQRSLWAAVEAEVIGYGGCVLLSGITGLSAQTIATRRIKLRLTHMASAGSLVSHQRLGRVGRKLAEVKDPDIVPALERMLSDEVAGDPMSQQKWVRSSIRNLSKKLKEQGHQAGHGTVARLLRKMGYSLQVNKKKQAGSQHPERDQQFRYIATLKSQFLRGTSRGAIGSLSRTRTIRVGDFLPPARRAFVRLPGREPDLLPASLRGGE